MAILYSLGIKKGVKSLGIQVASGSQQWAIVPPAGSLAIFADIINSCNWDRGMLLASGGLERLLKTLQS